VEKLLKSIKITRLTTRDEQEVVGYYDSLQTILEHYEGIDITDRYIHQLHGMLLKHSDKDQFHKGRYKTLSNQVVANYPDGSKKIIFKTAEPHLVEPEMQELIQWVNDRITINDMHPLMVAGVFVYEFLSVHPYQDGNGRLSRLLTTLILLKFGYGFVQYVSFEHIVETKKEAYYRALMDGQKNRYKKDERIDLWMFFFLECLNTLVKRLEEKYNTLNKLSLGINERQQKIIAFIRKNKSAQLSDVESALEIYSKNTLKKDLSKLLDEGLLIRTGAGRSVRYHFKS
jgi:Fic family protein